MAGQIIAYSEVFVPMVVEMEDARAGFAGFVQVLYDMRSTEAALLAHYEELGALIEGEGSMR
jgi:hypothetical protein